MSVCGSSWGAPPRGIRVSQSESTVTVCICNQSLERRPLSHPIPISYLLQASSDRPAKAQSKCPQDYISLYPLLARTPQFVERDSI